MKNYQFNLACGVSVVSALVSTVQAENVKAELQAWIKEQAKTKSSKEIKDLLKPDFALYYGVSRFSTLTEYKAVSKYIERAVKAVQDAAKKEADKADASKADASKADAGKVDAGKADAGKVDAGKVDAGKVDAGKSQDALDTDLENTVDTMTIDYMTDLVECLYMQRKKDFLAVLSAVTGKTLK